MKVIRHAINDNGEFFLCGLAFDEPDDDGLDRVQAGPCELVTCANCRNVLDHVRRAYRRYRMRDREEIKAERPEGDR